MVYKRKRTTKSNIRKRRGVRRRGPKKRLNIAKVVKRLINKKIETKESQRKGSAMQSIYHNNTRTITDADGAAMNPFTVTWGTQDPMEGQAGNRIGDEINVKGLSIKMFLENPIDRANTHYRIMLLKGAKGDTFGRSTIFKGDSDLKIMDVINTERYTIVAQKIVNLKASNGTSSSISLVGVPGAVANAGFATKLVTMWIPGSKFGRDGHIQYENASSSQVKFYDYRLVVLAYDWYGTPQDANIVGKVNECFMKLYFKDA